MNHEKISIKDLSTMKGHITMTEYRSFIVHPGCLYTVIYIILISYRWSILPKCLFVHSDLYYIDLL